MLITLILLIAFAIYGFRSASANLDHGFVSNTVPTRTPIPQPTEVPPTSQPAEPTESNDGNNGGNNGQNDNSSPLTATPSPPTAVPVTIAPTPINGFVEPTRCGDPFFVATLGTINVRSEPSTDGEIVSKMVYLEARQVLGRWSEDSWWKVLLPDTSTGWVYDSTGSMIGVMEGVPVINTDGTPADQVIWQPTPDLECPTITPEATATETASLTETAEPTETSTPVPTAAKRTTNSETGAGGSADPAPTTEVTIDPSVISALPQTQDSPIESSVIVERESTQKQEIPSSVTTSGSSIGSSNTPLLRWPIIVGILLILFGVTTLFIQRRKEQVG